MAETHIKMGHVYGETPSNVLSDFEWVRRHEQELLKEYGEVSIIVYQRRVIGVGENYAAALADAERNMASIDEVITPIHQRLSRRHRLFTLRPR